MKQLYLPTKKLWRGSLRQKSIKLFFRQVSLKKANPGLFFIYFRLLKHNTNFTTNTNVKNVHPIYVAWIQTHDLWNIH